MIAIDHPASLIKPILIAVNENGREPRLKIYFLLLSVDTVDACINRDMSMDAVDYEAESWSLTVEHKFCKKQDKRAVKRQDVIYGEQITEIT